MDVKEAIAKAKSYVQEIFQDERISNLGLEEVEPVDRTDDTQGGWAITIAFSRPWSTPLDIPSPDLGISAPVRLKRSYKIVRILANGEVRSVKNRPVEGQAE
jgi:hypothetical protein